MNPVNCYRIYDTISFMALLTKTDFEKFAEHNHIMQSFYKKDLTEKENDEFITKIL